MISSLLKFEAARENNEQSVWRDEYCVKRKRGAKIVLFCNMNGSKLKLNHLQLDQLLLEPTSKRQEAKENKQSIGLVSPERRMHCMQSFGYSLFSHAKRMCI